MHDYDLDPTYIASYVNPAKASAIASGQRLLYEEFGAEGSDKQSDISGAVDLLIKVRAWLHSNVCRN